MDVRSRDGALRRMSIGRLNNERVMRSNVPLLKPRRVGVESLTTELTLGGAMTGPSSPQAAGLKTNHLMGILVLNQTSQYRWSRNGKDQMLNKSGGEKEKAIQACKRHTSRDGTCDRNLWAIRAFIP